MKIHKLNLTHFLAFCIFSTMCASQVSPPRAISESRYDKAHSLGENYVFDPRDGWQTVNVTNLQYKYQRRSEIEANDGTSITRRAKAKGISGAIASVLKGVFKGLKGLGKQEDATVTWYTGHDLLNPSCWSNGKWSPSDKSFACALTMEGWKNHPKCFKFLEVCNTAKKCVFVRVVDTCSGCTPGSKHIDMTKAAFVQLADFDVGVLQVKFRSATDPDTWFEKLWGPKVHGT